MLYASHMSSEEAEAAIHKSTNADQVAGRQRDRFPKRAVMHDAATNHPVLGLVGGILDNLELYTDKAKVILVAKLAEKLDKSLVPPMQYSCRFAIFLTKFVFKPAAELQHGGFDNMVGVQEMCKRRWGFKNVVEGYDHLQGVKIQGTLTKEQALGKDQDTLARFEQTMNEWKASSAYQMDNAIRDSVKRAMQAQPEPEEEEEEAKDHGQHDHEEDSEDSFGDLDLTKAAEEAKAQRQVQHQIQQAKK